MSTKKINYLARTFDDYRSELITFSNKYYPELADSYNDSSVGSWFIDLVSAVGDNLSYHIDRMYQETNINSTNLKSTVLNLARSNGLKVPGPKASMCEVKISCELPSGNLDSGDISTPNWSLAPTLKRTSVLSAGNLNFQLIEDVNFISDDRPKKATAKFRYRQNEIPVEIEYLDDGNIIVKYDNVKSVTPGQACVLYNGEECLGGGIIKEVRKNGKKLWYL